MAANPPEEVTFLQEEQVDLSSGVSMKVLWSNSSKANNKKGPQLPPLIFLHGSFHGAWCWSERFFPYFVSLGYHVAALNWRGTGGTFAGEGVKKVKMEEHVQDLKAFLEEFVPSKLQSTELKPILISHSFGGLSIMKYLEKYPDKLQDIGGAVIMCSVPPSGNGRMTMRFLRRSLRASWKITAGLAMKKVIKDPALCRELFFGGAGNDDSGVSDNDVIRYMGYFHRDSEATIDLMDLAKRLPSAQIDDDGKALFLSSPAASNGHPPFLVVGATEDFIVDQEGVDETAKYFGLEGPVMVDSPHDVMLGKKYQNAAEVIHQFVEEKVL
ncbi:Alpha beta hydrolase [Seminavis robusta]|uniref:Alpha beta hydrolase n=1 Tax=Seminavis robusta TaxID=568900 RepID=A0A9N8HMT1_9STRA|nr:Alpha beta hydrolase [Seminavis robusta]|eukprot:Sro929_g221360.1 Alpha beta hydrolase (326) ;mRNA; f:34075-35052